MSEEKVKKPLHEFLYTWRIENVHLLWQKNGDCIKSPPFKVEWNHERNYNLCMYPRGIAGYEDGISVYLARKNLAPIPQRGLRVDLKLLAEDGSQISTENSRRFKSMKKKGMVGYSQFISSKTLSNRKKYTPGSVLTLYCRIWSDHEGEIKGRADQPVAIKAFARTRIRKEVITKVMVINNIALKEQKIGEMKLFFEDNPIATFSASFSEIFCHKSLTISIDAKKNDKILMAYFDLALIDEKRTRIFWTKIFPWDDTSNMNNIVLSPLFSQETKQYVPHEMFAERFLFLSCEFCFTTGFEMHMPEKIDYGNKLSSSLLSRGSHFEQNRECLNLSEALVNMLQDVASHDVCIKTSTSSITAHDIVLSSRSDPLKMKIENKASSLETINVDEDADTMQKIVHFLYTDIVPDMNWQIALSLYSAGGKYQISLLKHQCRNFIKANLEISNVMEVLLLVKESKDKELYVATRDFIKENSASVFNTDEWSDLMKSDPNFALQIMSDIHSLNLQSKYQLE